MLKIIANTEVAVRRFPISSLFSLLFCILSLTRAEYKLEGIYLLILFCGCLWFIALKLFAESHAWLPMYYHMLGTAIFSIIVWHLYTSPNLLTTFGLLGAGLFLSIFIAPFLNKRATSMQVCTFSNDLWFHICFTFLAAVLLYLGAIAIVTSLSFLFGIKFYEAIYIDIWLVVATFFSPLFAMSCIQKRFDIENANYPKATKLALYYIVLPVLFIYAGILYGYIAKILITWTLPRGGVVYLVSSFGCIGIIAYLASYPLHRDHGIIGLFCRNFFKILIVPLVLFAIGIGIRIHAYGITEGRYIVLLCLIWFAISTFFALIKTNDQTPKFILLSITILLLTASFGPWSAINISTWSQLSRLESLLEKNQVLVNNHIHNPAHALSRADRVNISAIMDYIVATKKTNNMKSWFSDLPNAQIHQKLENYSAETIMQDMGIGYISAYNRGADKDYYNFSFDWRDQPYLEVSGYDYLVDIGSYSINQIGFTKDIRLDNSNMRLSVKLDPSSNNYTVLVNANESMVFGLEGLIRKAKNDDANRQNLIMNKESSTVSIRLIINHVYGKFDKDSDKPIISSINTTLLVKKK